MTITDTPPQQQLSAVLQDVQAALQASDTGRAMLLAREGLSAGLEHPLLLNLRAFWHESAGRENEAHRDLLRANELAPDDVPVLNALGLSYARRGMAREAVRCFDRIIAQEPNFGPAYFNRGWNSEQIGELIAARDSYERAIALMPHSGGPLAHMAALQTRLGHWNEARNYAERALALEPGATKAVLAMAAFEQTTGKADAALARLREMTARSDLQPLDRAEALGQIGDILDKQGRTAEAFDQYRLSNDVTRQMHAARFAGASGTTIQGLLRWTIDYFEKMEPDQWPPAEPGFGEPDAPAQHVFLLGFPRSGTTLLEQVLESHPAAVTSGERDTLSEAVSAFMMKPEDLARLQQMRGSGLSRYRRGYWDKVRSYGFDIKGRVFVDKQPVNTVNLPVISKLFPKAKILFAIRDPRDVVLSCFRRRFQINPSNFELLTLDSVANYYAGVMRLAELYRAKLPLTLMELHHERLVDDFEGQMRLVCDFIGLPWDDQMRDFAEHAKTRAIATPSAAQVTRGLNREGVAQWRRYEAQMAPVLPTLRPWVERFGYPVD